MLDGEYMGWRDVVKGRTLAVNVENARRYVRLLRLVAHPTRLLILRELARGMKCVTDIIELVGTPQPNVSQHLTALKDGGLVLSHKDGVARCYHLARPSLVRGLFGVLDETHPLVPVDDPERCRAVRKARRRARSSKRGQRT
jgi:ArsR family transcriptional regulator